MCFPIPRVRSSMSSHEGQRCLYGNNGSGAAAPRDGGNHAVQSVAAQLLAPADAPLDVAGGDGGRGENCVGHDACSYLALKR